MSLQLTPVWYLLNIDRCDNTETSIKLSYFFRSSSFSINEMLYCIHTAEMLAVCSIWSSLLLPFQPHS